MSKHVPLDETRYVYADHAAATPIDPEISAIVAQTMQTYHGNPSSLHRSGREARHVLEDARGRVAQVLGVEPYEIIFTSGGSEADNLAILGVTHAIDAPGTHLLISAVEHRAVLACGEVLLHEGHMVTYLPVNHAGRVDPDELSQFLRPNTALVSIMYVNNEIGTVEPIPQIASVIREYTTSSAQQILLHTDACQAVGYLPISPRILGVDLLTLNGAKMYGPHGVGVLYRRKEVRVAPLTVGGDQEFGVRAGTESVALAVGFAYALERAEALRVNESARLTKLRTAFITQLTSLIPDIRINGHETYVAPHIVHVTVPGIEGESMLLMLDARGIEVATGSACSSTHLLPSHVLTAIGQPDDLVHGSIRFSFGRSTTIDDVYYTTHMFAEIIKTLSQVSHITINTHVRL